MRLQSGSAVTTRPRISVRYNVFGSGTTGIITWAVPREFAGRLEITNNTFQQGRLQFTQGVPQRRVTVRNNIFPDNIWFVDDPDHPQPKALELPTGWQVDHNCFGGTTTGKYSVPVTARDVRADPQFLSRDPSHPDYLRLPANSPLGKAGAGGGLSRRKQDCPRGLRAGGHHLREEPCEREPDAAGRDPRSS